MSKVLLHDLDSDIAEGLISNLPDGFLVFDAQPSVHHCNGCFGCWIKTPGRCVISDRAQDFAPTLVDADEYILISHLYLGGLSPDVKAFMDRMIPSMLPFFDVQEGLMRHLKRGPKQLKLRYFFYKDEAAGTPSEEELALMHRLVAANAKNLRTKDVSVTYLGDIKTLDLVRY
jgi:multimeric flavodoxin WrbA